MNPDTYADAGADDRAAGISGTCSLCDGLGHEYDDCPWLDWSDDGGEG